MGLRIPETPNADEVPLEPAGRMGIVEARAPVLQFRTKFEMEANISIKSLRVLERNLTDQQVLEIYHSGKALFVLDEQTDEVQTLIRKATNRTLRCEKFLAKGKDRSCVRTYYELLFAGDNSEQAIIRMRSKETRAQFICEQIGIMTEMGYFFAKTMELANCLEFSTLQRDSVCRYIRRGKNYQRKIAQSV